MKLKSLTMLVMSGVLTASLAYITPVMADDNNDNANQAVQAPSDVNAQNQTNGVQDNSTNSQDDNSATPEGTPDTATGDDDY